MKILNFISIHIFELWRKNWTRERSSHFVRNHELMIEWDSNPYILSRVKSFIRNSYIWNFKYWLSFNGAIINYTLGLLAHIRIASVASQGHRQTTLCKWGPLLIEISLRGRRLKGRGKGALRKGVLVSWTLMPVRQCNGIARFDLGGYSNIDLAK